MSENNVLWTPDGFVQIGGTGQARNREELSPGVGEWLRQFADVAPALGMWITCKRCDTRFEGLNSTSDATRSYGLMCNCREVLWLNRDARQSN